MTPRASKAGRRILQQSLPPALHHWIELVADAASNRDQAYALCGFLAAVAIDLKKSYQIAGSEVRELILGLHEMLKPESAQRGISQASLNPISRESLRQLHADFGDWLKAELSGPQAVQWRTTLLQWIDVANERLTLRAYHRTDQRARQARLLIAEPMKMLGVEANDGLTAWAELLVRFIDLLESAKQAEIGRNRIALPSGFGGFYGVNEPWAVPDENEILAAIGQLENDLKNFDQTLPLKISKVVGRIRDEILSATATRTKARSWPKEFLPNDKEAKPSFWKKMLGR